MSNYSNEVSDRNISIITLFVFGLGWSETSIVVLAQPEVETSAKLSCRVGFPFLHLSRNHLSLTSTYWNPDWSNPVRWLECTALELISLRVAHAKPYNVVYHAEVRHCPLRASNIEDVAGN